MRIARKFKQLTRYTYPHGTEHGLLQYLPKGYKEDGVGNFYFKIGNKPSTMFTCHLDTACSEQVKVNHVEKGNIISTDGTSVLGADDKAGMVVLLYMIENKIPGLYYFFTGEEVGCIGSSNLALVWEDTEHSKYINKIVSFDRRGTDSVITEQGFGQCCSDEFADDLSNKLNLVDKSFNFSADPTGIYTDSAEFMDLIPECTNVSVGYYSEHTTKETQDIEFLRKLCKAVCLIDWESLPVVRDPKKYFEYSFYNTTSYRTSTVNKKKKEYSSDELTWLGGNYSYFDVFNNDTHEKNWTKLYISDQRIDEEVEIIENWIKISDAFTGVKDFDWDGNSLYITEMSGNSYHVGDRGEIEYFVTELCDLKNTHLRKDISLLNS